MNEHKNLASEDNVKSPSTYGKDAYEKYRIRHKSRKQKNNLVQNYNQKRTKKVADTGYTITLAQIFRQIKFPANKSQLVQFLLQTKPSKDPLVESADDILSLIQQIEEKKYKTIAEVARAVDLIRDISSI
jgi:hypothetical protein